MSKENKEMKNTAKIGILMILLAFALTACATTKVENIVRSAQPVGKIETLLIQVETSFAEGRRLRRIITNELQKSGIKVAEKSDVVLEIEIENIQIGSGTASATIRS